MNNNEEKRSVGAHNLILEERGNLTITGVEDVDSFDEETVVVYTGLGELTVRGSGLHINKIDVEAGELSLNCLVERGTGNLLLRFKDRGKPFNPLAREDPDLTLALEERPVGGLGIYMVKQFVDEADYEYRDGFNILTLRKRIAPQT